MKLSTPPLVFLNKVFGEFELLHYTLHGPSFLFGKVTDRIHNLTVCLIIAIGIILLWVLCSPTPYSFNDFVFFLGRQVAFVVAIIVSPRHGPLTRSWSILWRPGEHTHPVLDFLSLGLPPLVRFSKPLLLARNSKHPAHTNTSILY